MTRADLEKYSTEELKAIGQIVPVILNERRTEKPKALWADIRNAILEYWRQCGSITFEIDASRDCMYWSTPAEIEKAMAIPGEITLDD
jgi:hypothetical protein